MIESGLVIDTITTDAAETTLRMSGNVDGAADAALADAYGVAAASGAARLVLDFAAVHYINSTGIALIVRLLADARRDRREVIAMGLSEHYREIFRLTRLSDFMTIADPAGAAG
jgi:anti-sigma B factor antagonist